MCCANYNLYSYFIRLCFMENGKCIYNKLVFYSFGYKSTMVSFNGFNREGIMAGMWKWLLSICLLESQEDVNGLHSQERPIDILLKLDRVN